MGCRNQEFGCLLGMVGIFEEATFKLTSEAGAGRGRSRDEERMFQIEATAL